MYIHMYITNKELQFIIIKTNIQWGTKIVTNKEQRFIIIRTDIQWGTKIVLKSVPYITSSS